MATATPRALAAAAALVVVLVACSAEDRRTGPVAEGSAALPTVSAPIEPESSPPTVAETTISTITSTSSTTLPPRQMTFHDEFDGVAGSSPDRAVWSFERGGDGWGNRQLQFYTDRPENVSLDGEGHLVITSLPVAGDAAFDPALGATPPPCWYGACVFTSARIDTSTSFAQRYGRFEARLRMPDGGATWPAFWMLGSDREQVGWPASGEIDVVEHIGSEDSIRTVLHGPGYSGGNGIRGLTVLDPLPVDEFHVYAIEWTPDAIVWLVDDAEIMRVTPDDLRGDQEWVFDKGFYVILNLAVGGTLAGDPTDDDLRPHHFVVDWVRVFA